MPGRPELSLPNRAARHTPRMRNRVWFGSNSNAYVYTRSRSLPERLYPMPVEGEPVFAHCDIDERGGAATPGQVRALRRAVRGAIRWGGGTHFVNKRVANNRRVPLLAEAFPAARFIDLTRDGRAVALSLSRVDWWEGSVVWWYGDTPKAWRDGGGDPWELCARNWVEEVRAIDDGLSAIAGERVLHLRYEEFVAEPRGTARQIAAFMGLDSDPRWLEAVGALSQPDRSRSWESCLSPDQVAVIESVQAQQLGRLGYR